MDTEDTDEEGGNQGGGGWQRAVPSAWQNPEPSTESSDDSDEEGNTQGGGWIRATPSRSGTEQSGLQIGARGDQGSDQTDTTQQELAVLVQAIQDDPGGFGDKLANGDLTLPEGLTNEQRQMLDTYLSQMLSAQIQESHGQHQQLGGLTQALRDDPESALDSLLSGDLEAPDGLTDQHLSMLDQYLDTQQSARLRGILQHYNKL